MANVLQRDKWIAAIAALCERVSIWARAEEPTRYTERSQASPCFASDAGCQFPRRHCSAPQRNSTIQR